MLGLLGSAQAARDVADDPTLAIVGATVLPPDDGEPGLGGAFGYTMFFLLYIPEYYRQMPALVHAAAGGDYQPLVQAVAPLIIGTMDPVAPPRWGDHMARTLDNVLHLPIERASHLPVFPGCTAGLVEQFLDDARLASLDSTCAAGRRIPPCLVRSMP